MSKYLVTGAGGFIGGHMVDRLVREGHQVTAVDIKNLGSWWNVNPNAENLFNHNLTHFSTCQLAMKDSPDFVYNFAADMGGMGYIENNKLNCMLSVLINTHLLKAAADVGVRRYFFSSSACVYPDYLQNDADVVALKEEDAYPAMPEDGYGWEKLFSERMCRHYTEDLGIETRVARFHNVYGPRTSWVGGREKAPAAICRKVIEAKWSGSNEIEIWGDGEQTRSFMYVDDCIEGSTRIMDSHVSYPINLGSDRLVTINELVTLVEGIAGVKLERKYNLDAPKGVRGRNSDNTLITEELGWAPSISLEEGLEKTYQFVYDEMLDD